MPNKLTDAEIKKALEEWRKEIVSDYQRLKLLGAPMDCFEESHGDAITNLTNALDLINRQEAEKQNLEIEFQAMRGAANSYKAEVERLKTKCGLAKFEKYKSEFEEFKTEIKAEAVKKFAERLKEEAYTECDITGYKYQAVQIEEINNLLKELVGDGN